jgi:hypothetical protein
VSLAVGKKRQSGAVLLVLLIVIVLGAASLLVSKLGKLNTFLQRDQHTMIALAEAKSALLGWSVAHPVRSGLMPFSDRSSDGLYDGMSDCTAVITINNLIGRLPRFNDDLTTFPPPCDDTQQGLGLLPSDGAGEVLWVAVSPKLVYDNADSDGDGDPYPVIDATLLALPNSNWFRLFDASGALLSERVAVVIIAPGSPVDGQQRIGAAGIGHYLDSVTIGATTYSNADLSRDFIAADPGVNFNDRLVTITIDELLNQVDVVQTLRSGG